MSDATNGTANGDAASKSEETTVPTVPAAAVVDAPTDEAGQGKYCFN